VAMAHENAACMQSIAPSHPQVTHSADAMMKTERASRALIEPSMRSYFVGVGCMHCTVVRRAAL
jgi:hypothetical protein